MTRSSALVGKLAGALTGKVGRRGFFAGAAVAGTALAVSPRKYALTPLDAYTVACTCQGQSCDCGSMCCDGYTEFCCTLTGYNQCPAGTLLAGWWKVDGTGFCSGPRYYMDCNAPCNGCGCGGSGVCSGSCSGTGCGCANGDCGNRKAGCTMFRYGQCNQGLACVGPIVCRIVTCIAPWEIDGTCTGTVRVDAATGPHDRACLHRIHGSVDAVEPEDRDGQSGIRVRGWAFDSDVNDPLRVHVYVDGIFTAELLANRSRPDLAAFHPGQGPFHGYDEFIPVAGGRREVCVYAINAGYDGSGNPQLGCRVVNVAARPFGYLDSWSRGLDSVSLVGWAIDPDTTDPIDVEVLIDGAVRQRARANVRRDDVAKVYPQFGPLHGFSLTVPVPSGRHEVCVRAVNVGVAASPTTLGCFTVVMGAPIGGLDVAQPRRGGALVSGWAIDTDRLTTPVTVRIDVDGRAAGTVVADLDRPDVAAQHPSAGARHGFTLEVDAQPGSRQLRATALDVNGGPDTVIGERTIEVPAGAAFGGLDAADGGRQRFSVRGWVLDPDATGPSDVEVEVDGEVLTRTRADRRRRDIEALYPGYGPVSGFELEVAASPGLRRVRVLAVDRDGSRIVVGVRQVMVSAPIIGRIEAVEAEPGAVHVVGWVVDEGVDRPLEVELALGGTLLARGLADLHRPDLEAALPGRGVHVGFDLRAAAPAGTGELCLRVVDTLSRGLPFEVECREVTVPGAGG